MIQKKSVLAACFVAIVGGVLFVTPSQATAGLVEAPFVDADPSLEEALDSDAPGTDDDSENARELVEASSSTKSKVVATADSGAEFVEHPNGIVTVSVDRGDGAVQALASFPDATAGDEVIFEVAGELSMTADGLVEVVEPSGDRYTVLEPWAKDANGVEIPTHYEVRGSNLVQVVEHSGGDYAYPVVADPWLGVKLFTGFTRDSYQGPFKKSDHRYNGWVTPKGAIILGGGGGVGGYLAGQKVFKSNGWNEWTARFGKKAMTSKATLRQQYNCHVAASLYGLPFTKDYNLERIRPNKAKWTEGLAKHRCNWVK